MKKVLIYFFIIAAVMSCSTKPADTAQQSIFDRKKAEAEIKQTLEDYFAAIKNKGLMAEFDYLDSSADFFWVPPGYSKRLTYKETREAIVENARSFSRVENKWENLEIHLLSNELGSYTGVLLSMMTDTAGKQQTYKLIETGVLIKRAKWKLLNGQTSVLPIDSCG